MIHYDYNKFRVQQYLGYISSYDLEGDFDKVVEFLKETKKNYTDWHVKNKKKVKEERSYAAIGEYLDGVKEKEVSFDRLYIALKQTEDSYQYEVWGERDFLPEEKKHIIKNRRKLRTRNCSRIRHSMKSCGNNLKESNMTLRVIAYEPDIKLKEKLSKHDKKRIQEITSIIPFLLEQKLYEQIVATCQSVLEAVEDPEDRKRKWEDLKLELDRP